MDLRVIKTKKNIRDAFLELRKKHSLDEIKVNALCEKAMVNKTTFYNHYQDIYQLSEELENEVVENFLNNFQDIDMMLTDSQRFINGMHKVLESENDMLRIVFKDKMDELIERMEKRIQNYYPKENQMLVSFLIGGSVHLMMKPNNNNEDVEQFLIEVITKIV
ncbi:MAG: TetR/AcrR family transcriptional regulator [Agathobacter sp.]|nr:TetR/AcrR family transcriptional regulator [Agathobacter sp.]